MPQSPASIGPAKSKVPVSRDGSDRIVQCLRRLPNGPQLIRTIDLIKDAYQASDEAWIVGYSGGKDSTAIVKLVFQALLRSSRLHKPVTVIYCDTGVDIPMASSLAITALSGLRKESLSLGLPIQTAVLSPPMKDRFFVKVIGRGYPPPTDKFRWCTDRLRINPVTQFLRGLEHREATVLLGVRAAESPTRKLTLVENKTADHYWRTQKGISTRRLFLPILDYSTLDVWHANLLLDKPVSVLARNVADLYANASGECPTIREVKGAPCGKARFGCWTCTVAKKGVTLRNLIAAGESSLKPLLRYRLWLEEERNNPRYRWPQRRNGAPGLGPMTIEWRRLALRKLMQAQRQSGLSLIHSDEVGAIRKLWEDE